MFPGSRLLVDKLIGSIGQEAAEVNTSITPEKEKRVAYIAFFGFLKQINNWGSTATRVVVSNPPEIRYFFTEKISEKTNVTCWDYARALGLELVDGVRLYNVSFERLKIELKDPSNVVILDYPVIQKILSSYSSLQSNLWVDNWKICESKLWVENLGTLCMGIVAKVDRVKKMWSEELRVLWQQETWDSNHRQIIGLMVRRPQSSTVSEIAQELHLGKDDVLEHLTYIHVGKRKRFGS